MVDPQFSAMCKYFLIYGALDLVGPRGSLGQLHRELVGGVHRVIVALRVVLTMLPARKIHKDLRKKTEKKMERSMKGCVRPGLRLLS